MTMVDRWSQRLQTLVDSDSFHSTVLSLILLNAVVMGLEAVPALQDYGLYWFYLLWATQLAFTVELLLRIGAHGRDWRQFFADSWNRFDFLVIAIGWVPAIGGLSLIARLLRLLRVLRLVSGSASMRAVLSGRALTAGAIWSRLLLLLLLLYIQTLAGYYLFGEALPQQWGDLAAAAQSIGQLLSLYAGAPVARALYAMSPLAVLFILLPPLCLLSVCFHGYRAWAASRRGGSI
ncbi:ion transporter [Permianibacter sp. IMCC34836]|uniref:ion transporter n=1 Tax=Permianibacter fluminis TaxID=2738515 RepID=UPI001551FD9D|nr:ion transporter [Permianibacter fluminis]NQD35905.1 ion transporter [Permianibacter fluminis]